MRTRTSSLLFPIVVFCLFFGSVSQSFADEIQKARLHPRLTWELGPEVSYFKYEETHGGDSVMDETGVLYGIKTAVTGHTSNNLMWRLSGRFDFGELDYDGQLQDGTPIELDTKDYIVNLKGLLGWDFGSDRWRQTLYTGLGYRYWINDIESQYGYVREVSWLYLPIGYEAATPMGENWIFRGAFEFDILAKGTVESHLKKFGLSTIENDQDFGSGYGFGLNLDFIREVENSLKWSIGCFVNYMHVDKTDVNQGFLEPENETTEVGLRVSFLF